jgi:uncharacterized cupredoxin-like copper-binding protein
MHTVSQGLPGSRHPIIAGASLYSIGLMPATTYVVSLTAGDSGKWEIYCNILDHIGAGMRAKMLVA